MTDQKQQASQATADSTAKGASLGGQSASGVVNQQSNATNVPPAADLGDVEGQNAVNQRVAQGVNPPVAGDTTSAASEETRTEAQRSHEYEGSPSPLPHPLPVASASANQEPGTFEEEMDNLWRAIQRIHGNVHQSIRDVIDRLRLTVE